MHVQGQAKEWERFPCPGFFKKGELNFTLEQDIGPLFFACYMVYITASGLPS